jgi:hypothetical protein
MYQHIWCTTYYYLLGIAGATVWLAFVLSRSRVGLALTSIGEDESKADTLGINVTYYKIIVWAEGSAQTRCADAVAPGLATCRCADVAPGGWRPSPLPLPLPVVGQSHARSTQPTPAWARS